MKSAYEKNKEWIQKLRPSMSYDGTDFATWQQAAKKKLASLLGMDKFVRVDPMFQIEYEKMTDTALDIRFSFQSEEGYRVPCHLLLPRSAEKPPLMICMQGHSKGMHISLGIAKYPGDEQTIYDGDRDFCVRALREGYAALAIEQRNFGECGGDENGPRCFESSMTALLMGRTTIGERLWDVARLIDVLEMEFKDRINLQKICCMGNSGGGTVTAYAAALEDRICLAMPSCAMCTYKDSIGAMYHCSCNYVPRIAEYFDMNDLVAMGCPKFYIQVSGKEDPIFPIRHAKEVFEKVKNVYSLQNAEHRCTLVQGSGGHRFYADDAWLIVHKCIGV